MKTVLAFLLLVSVAQAQNLKSRETTHNQLNANLGRPDDSATQELFKFLDPLIGTIDKG